MEKEPRVVSKNERWLIYGFFGAVDALQIALNFTVYGEIANHAIDIIAGLVLLGYGMVKKLWTGKKLLVLLATFIGEQIPFVNALPFWTFDVRNLFSGTITPQEKEAIDHENFLQSSEYQPLNIDGERAPRNPDDVSEYTGPANRNGHRAPGGGLRPMANRSRMVDIKPSRSVVK